jgi:hypothetical protein
MKLYCWYRCDTWAAWYYVVSNSYLGSPNASPADGGRLHSLKNENRHTFSLKRSLEAIQFSAMKDDLQVFFIVQCVPVNTWSWASIRSQADERYHNIQLLHFPREDTLMFPDHPSVLTLWPPRTLICTLIFKCDGPILGFFPVFFIECSLLLDYFMLVNGGSLTLWVPVAASRGINRSKKWIAFAFIH